MIKRTAGQSELQTQEAARQQEQQRLEEKIWLLFGELETGRDEAEQTAVREKIWRLAEKSASVV